MSQPFSPPPPPSGASGSIPNNLVIAIVATIVSVIGCCLPHGLISLIFALQVNKKAVAGEIEGATNAARQAKMWAWISIGVGILGLIVWVVAWAVFGLAAFWSR